MTSSTATRPGATPGAAVKHLKKGELIFSEGDTSRAMYLVRTGMIRIFKKRGESQIEIDTIRAGQILGELAFLDGNPRSASAEVMTDVELLEISGPVFQNVLAQIPEWMKLLLKTIVGRLRTASNRIRQLEQSSTAIDYSDKDGKRSSVYNFISHQDLMKTLVSFLVTIARHGELKEEGFVISQVVLSRYANQILGVPLAKVSALSDLLVQAEEAKLIENDDSKLVIFDIDFLEKFCFFLNDENLLEATKRHDLSTRQFEILSIIIKHLDRYPGDPSGLSKLNLAEVKNLEKTEINKSPFAFDEFNELVRMNYLSQMKVVSAEEVIASAKPEFLILMHRFQKICVLIRQLNLQKRK